MLTRLRVLGLLCLSAVVQPAALSSSVQEGEEEALKLWQKFCAGTSDQDRSSNSGGLFVFCSPTPLNDDVPEIDLRLNHDIKVSPEEKHTLTKVEAPESTTPEIPIARSVPRHRNGTRGRGGRRRLYYARKNTIEQQSKDGEQFPRDVPSVSENLSESSTQITVSSFQNETKTDPIVNQKDSPVSEIQKTKSKVERGSRRRLGGRRRVAVVDVKPVSLFVNNETTTTTESNINGS